MKRAILTLALGGGFLTLFAPKVLANEGRIILANQTVACEGISVWKEDHYRISGRCNGLVYPYSGQYDHYSLWVQVDGENRPSRIDDIEVGQFDGQVNKNFTGIFISAETDSSPRQPSDLVLASATIQPFSFTTQTQTPGEAVITPVPLSPTPSPTPVTLATGLRKLLITVFVVIGVVLGAVIGLVILSRRG